MQIPDRASGRVSTLSPAGPVTVSRERAQMPLSPVSNRTPETADFRKEKRVSYIYTADPSSSYQSGECQRMEVWKSVVAVAFLFAVVGNAVCPCAGATPAPAAPSTVNSSQLNPLPMPDIIGGPLSPAARTLERMAPTTTQFLTDADLEEFADGPLDMSITMQQML